MLLLHKVGTCSAPLHPLHSCRIMDPCRHWSCTLCSVRCPCSRPDLPQVPTPFVLASEERHERAQQELRARAEAEARAGEALRVFRCGSYLVGCGACVQACCRRAVAGVE